MTRHRHEAATEIRGRLLFEALQAEAQGQIGTWLTGEPVTLQPETTVPPIALHTRTDTGTMHAIHIA